MNETQKSGQGPQPGDPEDSLADEFTSLGRNFISVLQSAWDRPERQKLQQEIGNGLVDLGVTLRKEAKVVAESPVTQRVKTEVEDLGTRMRNAQLEAKVRQELISALHIMNTELAKLADVLATNTSGADPATAKTVDVESKETSPEGPAGTRVDPQNDESASDPAANGNEEPPTSTGTGES